MANYNTTSNCSRSNASKDCFCERRKSDSLMGLPVAMAYVPWQHFHDVYEPDKALSYGTIFPELNKPFFGKGGCPR